jgi:hypothetical protein
VLASTAVAGGVTAMTSTRATHRLRSGQPAVEIAPGFFKIPGEPVQTHLEIYLRHGAPQAVDVTDMIDISDDDFARKDWLETGQNRYRQALMDRFRKQKGE